VQRESDPGAGWRGRAAPGAVHRPGGVPGIAAAAPITSYSIMNTQVLHYLSHGDLIAKPRCHPAHAGRSAARRRHRSRG
jgi:hypothetical protein